MLQLKPNNEPNDIIVIGRFARTYGVHGWIKLISFTEPADNILSYTNWLLRHQQQPWKPFEVEEVKCHGQGIIAKIAGFDTPETVKYYTNAEVGIRRNDFPPLDPETIYLCDLPGYEVKNQSGEFLGIIESVFHSGAHDILNVRDQAHYLIPFVRDEFIIEVDKIGRQMIVAWASDDTA